MIDRTPEQITLPMPGDRWGAATVLASCWGNDDPEYGDLTYTLMLLAPQPPYYLIVTFNGTEYSTVSNEPYDNIIPAAGAYREAIGGY